MGLGRCMLIIKWQSIWKGHDGCDECKTGRMKEEGHLERCVKETRREWGQKGVLGWLVGGTLGEQPKDAVAFRSTHHYLFSAVLLIREEAAPERLSVEGAKSTGKSRTGLFTIKVWPEERAGWPQTREASGEARGRSEVEGESWKEMISLYFALSGMG